MTIDLVFGEVRLRAIPFRNFDDFDKFTRAQASSLLPPKRELARWSHVTQTWAAPPPKSPIPVRTALQCLVIDRYGNRDSAAQAAMLARIAAVVGLNTSEFKKIIQTRIPQALFEIDFDSVLSDDEKAEDSWALYGQVDFEHFVLRAPGGQIGDWALLTTPVDFTLSRSRLDPERPSVETGNGESAERVFAFIKSHLQAKAQYV